MRPEVRLSMRALLDAGVRTTDRRTLRHAEARLDASMESIGIWPSVRSALVAGCRQAADVIAGRVPPAARPRRLLR